MLYETLTPGEFCPTLPIGSSPVTLTAYARPHWGAVADDGNRWGVLILPGGGYEVVADSEGEPVALAFLNAGCQAFVLRYSTVPDRYPQQLLEAAAAMAYLKANQDKYGISNFAVCGFSAGGHLAGCLANLWKAPFLSETLGLPSAAFHPDAAILSYPVISAGPHRSESSFTNLLDGKAATGEYACLSLEHSVSAATPPAFLWCTCTDNSVPAENTLLYASALQANHIPFELHVYPHGPHAMSTATAEGAKTLERVDSHIATWLPLCCQWLDSLRPGLGHP